MKCSTKASSLNVVHTLCYICNYIGYFNNSNINYLPLTLVGTIEVRISLGGDFNTTDAVMTPWDNTGNEKYNRSIQM